MVLGAEVYPKIPWKKSRALPEGNGPIPQDTSELFGGITQEEIRRIMSEALDKSFDNLSKLKPENLKDMRATRQRLAGLEQDTRQPHIATETDVPADTKTHKCEEDAATDHAKHGDSYSAKRVDAGPPMCLTSFGDDSIGPPAFPCCRYDAMVEKSAAAPKPYLVPVEMRTLTAAGGFLPSGTVSTTTRTIFHQSPLWFCLTEGVHSSTSIQYATTYYSSFWKIEVLETKSRKILVFDPGGSTDRLRTCPFLGRWRALLCGVVFIWPPNGTRGWSVFL